MYTVILFLQSLTCAVWVTLAVSIPEVYTELSLHAPIYTGVELGLLLVACALLRYCLHFKPESTRV